MENNTLLTVKKFAKLANKTPQAIYKQLNNRLNSYVIVVDNQKMLEFRALEKVYGIKIEQPIQPKVEQPIQPIQPQIEIDTLKKLVEILENENAAKQKTIDMLNLKLDEEHANLIELTKQVGNSLQVITQMNLADKLIEGEQLVSKKVQDVPVPATAPEQAQTKKSWKWWK